MSATRDKTQKFTFVYSNLYKIYRDGQKPNEAQAKSPLGLRSGHVLKAEAVEKEKIQVTPHAPVQFIGKRIQTFQDAQAPQDATISSLKENLKSLNDLHSRLRFMLKELEDLIK